MLSKSSTAIQCPDLILNEKNRKVKRRNKGFSKAFNENQIKKKDNKNVHVPKMQHNTSKTFKKYILSFYSFVFLSFCPFVLLSFCPFVLCPFVLLLFCPYVLMSFCPFVLLSFCPFVLQSFSPLSFCSFVLLSFCPLYCVYYTLYIVHFTL